MGMTARIIGFKPPDDKWKQMKDVYDACIKADIEVPEEVERFFNGEVPDSKGVEIKQYDLLKSGAVKEYKAYMQDGFEVDLSKLAKDIKILRFVNAY